LSRLDKDDIVVPADSLLELYYSIIHAFDTAQDDLALHPISYAKLDAAQQKDPQLKQKLKDDKYHLADFVGGEKTRSLVCHNGKMIVVPQALTHHVTDWYHTVLCHPGINRAEESISQHLYWPKMRNQITNYVQSCPTCQKSKRKVKSMVGYHQKQQKLSLGTSCALILLVLTRSREKELMTLYADVSL
jgi:hypothetical protein